ncbi:hypothetical protein [Rhodanobacter sp. DHB23]|uniref:hypothetical protein n=1 Tax=Rhodanobacter sp. DHB23 TaxID=2775923 RepID=UPI00178006A2|nr:hypothetical protein [Rhodanobacter sp. DHB23]MBD8874019.1 hypothetical protein [Rhodanobacter sp. DHB23]
MAAQAAAIQNNLQNENQVLNNAANALINVLQQRNAASYNNASDSHADDSDDDDNSGTAAAPEPDPAPAPPPAATYTAPDDQPSTAAAVSNLLGDEGTPSQQPAEQPASATDQAATASAVSSLIGNAGTPPPASPSAPANNAPAGWLIDPGKADSSASAFPSDPANLPEPADPSVASDMNDTADVPDVSAATLADYMQPGIDGAIQIKDELSTLVQASGQTIVNWIANTTDDPAMQWLGVHGWNGSLTTAPLPTASDSPEAAANMTFQQGGLSVLGAIKGVAGIVTAGPIGMAYGARTYYLSGVSLVNSISNQLDLANQDILGNPQNQQNNQAQ